MAYTWGYIKDVSLSKLDLEEEEATVQNLLSRFPFYANEVITQICSAIKPKYSFANFKIYNSNNRWKELVKLYNLSYTTIVSKPSIVPTNEVEFWNEWENSHFVSVSYDMPEDFISFGDDICYQLVEKCDWQGNVEVVKQELHDSDCEYVAYNQVCFNRPGNYFISYNARWYTFSKNISDNVVLNVPTDILECIPSYVASQCYKIDDEYKASVFRNEYEIMLSRIDNSNFRNTKTIEIEGDW